MEQIISSLALQLGQQLLGAAVQHTQHWTLDDWARLAEGIMGSEHNTTADLIRCLSDAKQRGVIDSATYKKVCLALIEAEDSPAVRTVDLPVIRW